MKYGNSYLEVLDAAGLIDLAADAMSTDEETASVMADYGLNRRELYALAHGVACAAAIVTGNAVAAKDRTDICVALIKSLCDVYEDKAPNPTTLKVNDVDKASTILVRAAQEGEFEGAKDMTDVELFALAMGLSAASAAFSLDAKEPGIIARSTVNTYRNARYLILER